MNRKQLEAKRKKLVGEAEAFRGATGEFADDAARAAFDAKMTEAEAVDVQLRALTDSDGDPPPADSVSTERQRCIGIRQAVRAAKLGDELADTMIAGGTTLDAARAAIINTLAEQDSARGIDGTLVIGEDARDKFVRGVSAWLVHKAGLSGMLARAATAAGQTPQAAEFRSLIESPGEFRGLSLLDIGRSVLEHAGVKTRGLDRSQLANQLLSYRSAQGTSDFTVALENVMGKVLLAAYAITADTWTRVCKRGSVPDFRPSPRYRRGSFGRLDNLNEHGEFKNKPITDAEKATISADTVGNIVALTRKALVNDDMGFLSDIVTALGRAAKLSPEIDFYALLAQNAGLGPTMDDGSTLFHADHNNIGTGATLSVDAIDADRVVMASQKDKDGNDFLDLRPHVLLIALGLGGKAREINAQEYNDESNKHQRRPNSVRGLFNDIVDTPRITGTRRYLFADPAVAPVIEVVFLEGQEEPVLESKDGWRTDGMEWRARYDYGIGAIDWRGAETNAGTP